MRILVGICLVTLCPETSYAQTVDDWDSPRVLEIVHNAIAARRHAFADSSLRRFQANVQGHVYFLGEFGEERQVVRADQVALETTWEAPDRAVQVLVGRRHEVRLPTTIHYHTDHLGLVLDNFQDRIYIGEGDEVDGVLHPVAPGAPDLYEYRLGDSLEVRARGRTARVYSIEVRPRDRSTPAAVGTLFVERVTGALTRMRLTFTSAAYVDPNLVHIALDFRSGLWNGRYWLPVEQSIEIRRALRWLDFPLTSSIRTRLEILEYDFDPPRTRLGPGMRFFARPQEELQDFDRWESGLYGGPLGQSLLHGGNRADAELERAVDDAISLLGEQGVKGGLPIRPLFGSTTEVVRVRRGEGLRVGAGGVFDVDDRTRVSIEGGVALGPQDVQLALEGWRDIGPLSLTLEGWLNQTRDVGPAVASGVTRTLALARGTDDYMDPFAESGFRVGVEWDGSSVDWTAGLVWRRHRSVPLGLQTEWLGSGAVSPIRPVDEGNLVGFEASASALLGTALGGRWSLAATGELGRRDPLDGEVGPGFRQATMALRGVREGLGSPWSWSLEARTGLSGGAPPAQRLFLLGGRGTLPGHGFRIWGGERFWLARTEVERAIVGPWVSLRALLAGGAVSSGAISSIQTSASAAERFRVTASGGSRYSYGVGLGLFYGMIRLDAVRPVRALAGVPTRWTILFSVDPALWAIL